MKALRSPWQFFGRMRRGSCDKDGDTAGGSASSRTSGSAPARRRSQGSTSSSSSTPTCEAVAATNGGQAFRVRVPSGASPGDTLRFRAPDGRLIEIDLPPGCAPGQKVTIEVDPTEDWRGTLKKLTELVKRNFEATQASCSSSKEKLAEELQMQKGLWASASVAPQSELFQRQNRQDSSLAVSGASEELSQTQALVFASADAGDCRQLLAALQEAKKFSAVSRTLEDCCHNLTAAEEAMVTWRCLLDALEANNRDEIEVWVEEARGLGLEAPAGLPAALDELRRQEGERLKHFEKYKETEDKLKFALEADDRQLLDEVIREAETVGLRSELVQQATARSRAMRATEARPQVAPPPNRKAPVGGQWHPRPKSPPGGSSSSQARRSDGPQPPLFSKADGGVGNAGASSSSYFQGDSGIGASGGGAEAGAGPSPRPQGSTGYGQAAQVPDDGRSAKELLEECRRLGIDTTGCTDADDLRRLLVNRPKPEHEARPSGQGFVKQIPASQLNQAGGSQTVWNRQYPPPHLNSKRSKALYLLGLDAARTPKPAELRSAYRKAAMECHPDRQQNHARVDQAKDLFQKVKEAFDFISAT